MASATKDEGAQFVRYFGPLLDALRSLGGSASVEEAVDRVAVDLKIADEVLDENASVGRFSLSEPGCLGSLLSCS